MVPIVLVAAQRPSDMPAWITQAYLAKCLADEKMQKNWNPEVGHWYFCIDLYMVRQITDLKQYYSEGVRLSSDHGKNSQGKWTCDIYLPIPKNSN